MSLSLSQIIKNETSSHFLLKHPFYQAWTEGCLEADRIALYARQYFSHVAQFPRCLSAMHTRCEDLSIRQVLLQNLMDEELGTENHPELWLRFVESWKQDRTSAFSEKLLPETQELLNTFQQLCEKGLPEALGALYAYEHQVPEVAEFKIEALKKHYTEYAHPAGLKFFEVHRQADVFHSQALENILDKMDPESGRRALAGAKEASLALWNFLSGVERAELPKA